MGSLYFRSSDFDSLPKSDCKLSNQVPSKQSHCNISNPYAISTIRVQSQQPDCNPLELQLDYRDWFELQNRTAIPYHATSPTRGGMTNRICKLLNLCNLSNQSAIAAIRLQSYCIAVRLHRLIWIAKQNFNLVLLWIAFGLHREKDSIPGKYLESIGTWRTSGC